MTQQNASTLKLAKSLRANMTDGETRLWRELRDFRNLYGVPVRRQAPVGPYVADFAIHSKKLIIEIDGEHHFTASGQRRDRLRDAWFANQGYEVLRINTGELSENFDGCVETIIRRLGV